MDGSSRPKVPMSYAKSILIGSLRNAQGALDFKCQCRVTGFRIETNNEYRSRWMVSSIKKRLFTQKIREDLNFDCFFFKWVET